MDAGAHDAGSDAEISSHDAGKGPPDSGHDAGKGPVDAGHDARVADVGVDVHEAAVIYASTCAELKLSDGTAEETLYVGGNAAKPWAATCVTSDGGTVSKTYLSLPSGNVSAYPSGGCATSATTGVSTTWSKVLIDPTTFIVTTNDTSFSSSTGTTKEVSGNGTVSNTYDVMFFASARSCQPGTFAKGSVNLTGTSFVVAGSQTFTVQGSSASGSGVTTGENTAIEVEGYPAGISPCSSAGDYYTNAGGACLQLVYSP